MNRSASGRKTGASLRACPLRFKLTLSAIAALILSAFFILTRIFGSADDFVSGEGFWQIVLLALLFFGVSALMTRDGTQDSEPVFLVILFLTGLSLILRAMQLDGITYDYVDFLSKWALYFREHGGFAALGASIGDYNVPYLYFLAAISYIPLSDLYLIKLFSILFDYLMAFYAMKTAALYTKNRFGALAVFFGVLFYPTIWLNSAYWAQCDAIYAGFILISLYCALSKRPVVSVAMAALAFAFKLQTVFFLPVLIVFILAKRMKPVHLLVFPSVYFLSVLPAMLMGRPFWDILKIYFNQAGSYDDRLTLNAPSIFAFAPHSAPVEVFKWLGICAAAAFIAAVYMLAYKHRRRLNDKTLFIITILFALGIPFLLPSMHERYFYLADVLGVVYAAVSFKRWFVPYVILTASYTGYYAYLELSYLFDLKYAALLLLAVTVVLFTDLLLALRGRKSPAEKTQL